MNITDDGSQRWITHAKNLKFKPAFAEHGCANSLVAAYQFHTGKTLPPNSKEQRNIFVEAEHLSEINAQLAPSLEYALKDIVLTYELAIAVWPKYKEHVPSKVVFGGHLLLANSLVPVRPDWHDWANRVDKAWHDCKAEVISIYNQMADAAVAQCWPNKEAKPWEQIPGLCNLDWTQSQLVDAPVWYEWRAITGKELELTDRQELSHHLMQIMYRPDKDSPDAYPIKRIAKQGWSAILPDGSSIPVEHYKKTGQNTGSLISWGYKREYETERIQTPFKHLAIRLCDLSEQITYWQGMRTRVLGTYAHVCENPKDGSRIVLVAPRANPHGTASGQLQGSTRQ